MPAKTRNAKVKSLLFLLGFLFPGFCFLVLCGCNESLQITSRSGSANVDALRPEAVRIIQAGLADDNPRIRAKAIEVVAVARLIELMPKVQRLLKDDFVPVRFLAALAVGDNEYHLAKDLVRQLLRDEDENVRIAAAYAMTKLGSVGGLEHLHKAIGSKDQKIRANAVLLLGKSGDRSALRLLYWAKNDSASDAKVRFQAAEAIARLGDERIYPKLWTMLISKYIENKVMGIKAMGALGTTEAQNALISMLYDDVLEVRLIAAEQLGMLGDTGGEPEVLDVFTKNVVAGLDEKDIEQINVLAALAIGQIGTDSLVKFLPRLLKDKSKFVRIAAAKAVFQVQKAN